MQVKKFEAKSMKEALALVKQHLGPDAVILSARELKNRFGLVGQSSVEVTAAVSEGTLRKKVVAESKLPKEQREKFAQIPARQQKEFIDRVFARQTPPAPVEPAVLRPLTSMQYIDIGEEGVEAGPLEYGAGGAVGTSVSRWPSAQERIRGAAQAALQAVDNGFVETPPVRVNKSAEIKVQKQGQEIQLLKQEINRLNSMIEQFQKVPQTLLSSMHPGASHGIPYDLSSSFEKLVNSGISIENTVDILRQAKANLQPEQLKNKALVDAWVARYFLDKIEVVDQKVKTRYQVFVGPSGHGKTTSLVKMASQLVINERKKVAIVTADLQKVGAVEQLRIYSQILNVPFAQLRRASDWPYIDSKLKHLDHLLVDFPASNLKSMSETEDLRQLLPPADSGRTVHYVQSVLAKDSDAFELAQRYRAIGFQDVIFTQLDESVQHGMIYNFQHKLKVPLHSFGIGPQIPEDFEPATKERVVDLIFKLTKIRKDK